MPETIPYGRQVIEDDDVRAVVDALRGEYLTTGPAVERFESAFAKFVGAAHGVATCNATAALHLCMMVAGIGPGDEVIVPALTFAASANCVRYVGGTVVFADVRADTLTLDPSHVRSLITPRTRGIVAVDYAGLPADLDALREIADVYGLVLVEDACHAPGATYRGRRVGSIADLSVFSFHPVKHMTTGEGGMVTTNDAGWAGRLRRLRSHGITSDPRERASQKTWRYDMPTLGFNYRLTDLQAALGTSQLRKLEGWVHRRRALAARYVEALADESALRLQAVPEDREHAWHLFPVRFVGGAPGEVRQRVYGDLHGMGIGVNVHYVPVYWLSYYAELGYRRGLCPEAERAYEGLLSLPMWHGLSDEGQERVVESLLKASRSHG